jgi:hypothetical protein
MVTVSDAEAAEARLRRREYKKRWRAANPEKARAENRAKRAQRRARYPEKVREYEKRYEKRWRAANPEKAREKDRAKRARARTNPETARKAKLYYEAHYEIIRAKRRAVQGRAKCERLAARVDACICIVCGGRFTGPKNKRLCSPSCRIARATADRAARAAARPCVCKICGVEFEPIDGHPKVICSPVCRMINRRLIDRRDYYAHREVRIERHRQRRAAADPEPERERRRQYAILNRQQKREYMHQQYIAQQAAMQVMRDLGIIALPKPLRDGSIIKQCVVCGVEFEPIVRQSKIFCSPGCHLKRERQYGAVRRAAVKAIRQLDIKV